jgi:dUTP pyrophosphatase
MKVNIKKISPDATLPSYAHESDAGVDLFSSKTIILSKGERAQVPTGISMEIPEKYVGLIWDKSGLSHKVGLKTMGGVIDAGYRGEVMVGVINLGDESYTIEKGHKVAQMLFQKVKHAELEEVTELSETPRGDGGFGSMGK